MLPYIAAPWIRHGIFGSLSTACSVTWFPRPTPLLLPLFPMVRTLENQVSGVSQPKTRLRRFAALRCAYGESGISAEISGPKTLFVVIDLIWLGWYMEGCWLNELYDDQWWSLVCDGQTTWTTFESPSAVIVAPKSPRIHSSKEKDFL